VRFAFGTFGRIVSHGFGPVCKCCGTVGCLDRVVDPRFDPVRDPLFQTGAVVAEQMTKVRPVRSERDKAECDERNLGAVAVQLA
jgi:hypothetical protein